jgi:hypothetical protein
MLAGADAFYTVLTRVRDAMALALVNTPGGKPARVATVPGAIAWDECDSCGLLALALIRTYLSDDFPIELAQAASLSSTQGAWLCADMVVQVVRCAPQPVGDSLAPSSDALEQAARIVGADAYTAVCTVVGALQTMATANDIVDFLMRPQNIMGPEGACVGTELSFTVAVMR